MDSRVAILVAGLMLLAGAPAGLFLSGPGATATETYNLTLSPSILPGGVNVTLTFKLVNYDQQSLEAAKIWLPITPSNDTVYSVEAKVYNSTNTSSNYLVGTWSNQVDLINGTPVLSVYTQSLPLQTNYTLVVNFTLQTVATAGLYTVQVDLWHYEPPPTDVWSKVYTENLTVKIDAQAPSIYQSTFYVRSAPSIAFDLATVVDTINGAWPGAIGSVSLDSVKWLNSTTSTVTNITTYASLATTPYNESQWTLSLTIDNATLATDLGGGIHNNDQLYIEVTAVDAAGNTASLNMTVTIDNEPPTVTLVGVYTSINTSGAQITGVPAYDDGTNYWVRSGENAYIVVKYSDNQVTPTLTYSVAPSTTWNYTNTSGTYRIIKYQSLTADLTLTITASDKAGNTASLTTTVRVDGDPPTLTATVTLGSTTTTLTNDTIYRFKAAKTNITLSYGDSQSGVGYVGYTMSFYASMYDYLNGLNPTNSTGVPDANNNITLNGAGVYVVTVTVVDNVGNHVTSTYIVVNDPDEPLLWASAPAYANTNSTTVTVVVSDIDNLTITATVQGTTASTITTLAPPANGNNTVQLTLDLSSIASDGTYTIEVTAVDASGNPNTTLLTFTLDRASPYVSEVDTNITDVANRILDPNSGDTLVNKVIVIDDIVSGVDSASLQFYVNGQPVDPSNYTVSTVNATAIQIKITSDQFWTSQPDGTITLTFTASDMAGNTMTYTLSFTKDTAQPSFINWSITDAATGSTTYTGGEIAVKLNATDNIAIAPTVTITVVNNSDSSTIYSQSFPGTVENGVLSFNGILDLTGSIKPGYTYTVTVEVSDEYGHTASVSGTFQLDSWPPELYLGAINITGHKIDLGCYQSLSGVAVNVTDTGLGISSISVTLNGAPFTGYEYNETSGQVMISFQNLTDGSYSFNITVTDGAGLTSWAVINVTIDNTPPSIAVSGANMLTGGVELLGVNVSDISLTSIDVYLLINGQTYNLTGLSPDVFTYEYAIVTESGVTAYTSFEQLQYELGRHYATMANPDNPVDYPLLVIVDGRVFVVPGLYSENVTVNITIVAHDCALNQEKWSKTYTVEGGQFVIAEIHEGWNLFSMPVMSDGATTSTVVSWIEGSGSSVVYIYDKANGTWNVYIPGVSSTDYQVSDGMAFWIHWSPSTNETSTLLVAQGYLPYTTPPGGSPPGFVEYYLTQGGNFLGFTSPAPLPISYYLSYLNETGMIYEWVYLYNAENQAWTVVSLKLSPDRLVYPGSGMWVIVYQDTPFNVLPWYSWYTST